MHTHMIIQKQIYWMKKTRQPEPKKVQKQMQTSKVKRMKNEYSLTIIRKINFENGYKEL